MAGLLFQSAFLVVVLAYVLASVVLIYHIFAFGINRRTSIVAVAAYLIASLFLFGVLFTNLLEILVFT